MVQGFSDYNDFSIQNFILHRLTPAACIHEELVYVAIMIFNMRQPCGAFCALALIYSFSPVKAQVKIMTIGDSLTEEYHFETPFSAPDSDPTDANTMNWVEIFTERRGSHLNFGDYEGTQFAYPDYRRTGNEYNWGIPGYDTVMWMDIIEAPIGTFDFSLESLSRKKMRDHYDDVDVIVIMLGGNDVRANYGDLYDPEPGDITPTQFKNTVLTNLEKIIDEVRSVNNTAPIVLANIPDLTAAPEIIADHPDPTKRAGVTVIVNQLNQDIATLAANRGATLAPVSQLTDQLLSQSPMYIGAIQMIKDKDPTRENRPHYIFCKEGLHPSTNGQAIIANVLINAINSATGSTTPELPSREILTDLMGLNPDQPYLDWALNTGLTDTTMNADSDSDGIPNIGEYLLGLNPLETNTAHFATIQTITGTDYLTLSYAPDIDALRLLDAEIKYSTDLDDWKSLPVGALIDLGGGSFQARLPVDDIVEGHAFMRFEFSLRP